MYNSYIKFIDVIHFAINGCKVGLLSEDGIVMPKHVGIYIYIYIYIYRSFATRVSQLKIWHFLSYWYSKKRLQMHSVITQFAKLAAGEQLCRRCAHRKFGERRPAREANQPLHGVNIDFTLTYL